MPTADSIFSISPAGILISVTVTPKARSSGIDGTAEGPDGPALRVRLTEAPEKGKANAALIKLLAREWDVSRRDISVTRGAKSRRKTVLVEGESPALLSQLKRWVKERLEGD